MEERLAAEPVAINTVLADISRDPESFAYRRFIVEGTYDFSQEIILRNRRVDDQPGAFVVTPLKIKDSDQYIMVSRGFIPLPDITPETRTKFQKVVSVVFMGLGKKSVKPRFLAPQDPPASQEKRVDAWLRINLEEIQKQLPYQIAPIYLEVMSAYDSKTAEEKILAANMSRAELLMLPLRGLNQEKKQKAGEHKPKLEDYPTPQFDTVLPAGRHLGYVFEWAIMAFFTFLIWLLTQRKRARE